MRNPVRIRKRKYDRSIVWDWDGDLVDGDDDWLVVYHGVGRHTRRRHGKRPEAPAPYALSFLSTDKPVAITVYFDERGRVIEYQADAGLPVRFSGRHIEFVDLDLDLVVRPDLSYRVKDQTVFRDRAREMGYDDEAIHAAREGIRIATGLVEANKPPFDGSAPRMLGRILAAEGPV